MFKPTMTNSVSSYIDALPADRKKIIIFLHDFIQKNAPTLKPHFASNMIGYGSFPYTNYKKEKGEWPVIALANQKNYVSVYICGVIDNEYLAEKYKDELGKVNVGKSCIRFKKVDQVHLPTLKKVISLAAKNPGLVSVH